MRRLRNLQLVQPLRTSIHPAGLIRKFHEAKLNNQELVTCWGSGKPLREFIHVNDLADACIFALENWNPDDKLSPNSIFCPIERFGKTRQKLEISLDK